jgi:hypothetical protein
MWLSLLAAQASVAVVDCKDEEEEEEEEGEGDGEGEAGKEDDVELPEYLKNSKGKGMIKTVLCFSIVKTQYPETSLF